MIRLFEATETQLQRAADLLNLEPEMVEFLRKPMSLSEFRIPTRMKNDRVQIFTAYRVIHNDVLEPSRD